MNRKRLLIPAVIVVILVVAFGLLNAFPPSPQETTSQAMILRANEIGQQSNG